MAPFAMDSFGNSSGVHGVSRRAKNALEEARERIATQLHCQPKEVVFTSGGTESDNLALKGPVYNSSSRRGVVVGATEHDAVLETADFLKRQGNPVVTLAVDSEGRVDPDDAAAAVDEDTAVISVMLVNNETGALNDVGTISGKVRASHAEALVHTDAVQAPVFVDVDVDALGVDLLSLTGHKFGGPKGCGVLYVREGTDLEALIHGGGQELNRRSGTHNVAGAVGVATGLDLATKDRDRFVQDVGSLRDTLAQEISSRVGDVIVNTPASSSPHHLNVRFPGVRNETLLLRLDRAGVAASAGSACQSGAATVSHVLEAMGLTPAEARESVRFSLGWTSTHDEVIEAADAVVGLVGELR